MTYRLDFEHDELEQFDPHTREALLRLARQQQARREHEAMPHRGHTLRVTERTTEDDEARLAAGQADAQGLRLPPDLSEGDQPWRPPT